MKKQGFTLVELLAVIVILAIILAIAIPSITDVINNAKKSSFESNTKLVIDAIKNKYLTDEDFDLNSINVDTMQDILGISSDDYASISANKDEDGNIYVALSGSDNGKFSGLTAYGTNNNIEVSTSSSNITNTPVGCFTFDDSTGTITGYDTSNSSCTTDVIIPSKINAVTVTIIGDYAFSGKQITSIALPDTITTIGEHALDQNPLTSITIPTSVTTISNGAFVYDQLMSITIPSNFSTIEKYAFAYNQITDLTIPSNITSIGEGAFMGNQLTSIIIPDNVTSIGFAAFQENQLNSVTLPNNITSISESAFYGNNLTSVVIPDTVTSIGTYAFGYNQLASVTIGNSVTTIGDYAFTNNKLTSLYIPHSVTSIGDRTFCLNLITQGNLKIDNTSGSVSLNEYSFLANGFDQNTMITPVYLR